MEKKQEEKITLCIKYWSCKRCPRDGKCEKELNMAGWSNGNSSISLVEDGGSIPSPATKKRRNDYDKSKSTRYL